MVERITINVRLALLTNSNQVGALQSKIGQLEKDGYEIISVVNGQKAVFTLLFYVPSGDLLVVSRSKSEKTS